MALLCPQGVEVVFLYGSQRNGIDFSGSSNQRVLFFIVGPVRINKLTLHFRSTCEPVLHHRDAHRNLYSMDHTAVVSSDLPTGHLGAWTAVWNVDHLCDRSALLPGFVNNGRLE